MGDPAVSRRDPTLGFAAGACFTAAGLLVGLRPLSDNSFFTHLATGRLILDRAEVPSTDPYTFTAGDAPWVVQSWLASWFYATVEAVTGATGLRLLAGVVAAAVAAVVWTLARPCQSVLVRFVLCATLLVASASLWAERPFMLGLLALGVVMLAGEGRIDPRWLVPVGWLWVNTHGSFPLGLVYLGCVAAGSRLDGDEARGEVRAGAWLAAGIASGALGPLGPDALRFPFELVQRQEILRNVIEWRSPTFQTVGQRVFLVLIVAAAVLLVRRPSYRAALPYAVFVAMALLGVRNVPVAALVLIPGIAVAAPSLGALRGAARGLVPRALLVVAAVLAIAVGSARLERPDFVLARYPVDATAYLESRSIEPQTVRMAAPDIAGNFRELVYGARGDVFYDDRFDMFPEEVTLDHLVLVNGGARTMDVLDDHKIDLVMWERASGSLPQLVADPAWRVLYTDERWSLVCRRDADLGSSQGRC
ncbi:MAG: hypothetical protein ACLGI8_12120 [Acidimicrobiia bacterium]